MAATEGRRTDRLRRQRWMLVGRLYRALEPLFVGLSAIWIALIVAELGLGGLPRSLEILVYVIWGLFVVEFGVGFAIAPAKGIYLRHRWLTMLSLVLPALRILRLAPALRALGSARVLRPVGLLRVATSVNRGLGALGRTARRRGFGYVAMATGLVIVVGAAGMAFLESPAGLQQPGEPLPAGGEGGLSSFANALWWTAYAMTTGAPTTPVTAEGRLLGWILSVYGLAVFGYLTAVLASHFVDRDREALPGPAAGADRRLQRDG